jgi:hypothetical protein
VARRPSSTAAAWEGGRASCKKGGAMSTQKKSYLHVALDEEFLQRFHSCAILHGRSVKDAVREALELWMDVQEEGASVSGAHPVHKARESSTRPPKKGI